MMHLRDVEFVDYLDGVLPASRAAHLDACARCRQRVDDLRHTTARVLRTQDVPEPSPLFWEHFSQRVRAGVEDAAAAGASTGARWVPASLFRAIAVAAVALLAAVTIYRVSLPRPETTPVLDAAAVESPPSIEVLPLDLDADEEWGLVRVVADDLPWEAVGDAGLTARPGSAERVALEMSPAERQEFARLLEDQIKRPGA